MKRLFTFFIGLMCVMVGGMAQTSDYATTKASLTQKSLPLINITVEIEKVSKPEYTPATIEIADPLQRTDKSTVTNLNCKVKYRGSSAMSYDKKSFAIKLLNPNGGSLDMPMFGIRSDDAWILDAMAIDRLRMRNRINFDVWNAFSKAPYSTNYDGRNGTSGVFVELFINGKYHGLYCFSDKVNRKLLGLKKAKESKDGSVTINGVMYKCESWGASSHLEGYNDMNMDEPQWNTWSLDYPDVYPCAEAYMPLKNFIDYCTYSSDKDFKENMDENIYLDNLVDYHVFILAQGIHDCGMKNSFLSIVNINNGHRMTLTPWDLDCSLGGWWQGDYYDKVSEIQDLLSVKPYARLWDGNINDYRNRVASRWRTLCSQGIVSPEGFYERLDAYASLLEESGAWQREYDKWNGNPVPLKRDLADEVEYVKKWYKKNFDHLADVTFKDYGTTGVPAVTGENSHNDGNNNLYNIMGQKVGNDYKGIAIRKGRKIIMR